MVLIISEPGLFRIVLGLEPRSTAGWMDRPPTIHHQLDHHDRLQSDRLRCRQVSKTMLDADITGRTLPPVTHPKRWVAVGLALQLAGVGVPGGYLVSTANRESIGGHLTAATVQLAWRSDAHTTAGLVLLSLGLVGFGLGTMLMARPFVRRPLTAFVAVPIAGVAGMLVLGFVALIIAIIVGAGGWLDILSDWPFDGDRRKHRKNETSVGT